MILPFQMDRIPQAIGSWLARRRTWSPVGKRVVLTIQESGDPALFGNSLYGVIREVAAGEEGELSKALIELDRAMTYRGHYSRSEITKVISTPYLLQHGLPRLLVTSAAVRVFDADNFASIAPERIIASATMQLDRGS